MGKSALGLCIAANLGVRHQTPVALFTLEMSKSEVTQRMMCSEAKVESQRLRTGPPRAGRLAAADGCVRPTDEGADLRRRHGLDVDHGASLEGAAAQVARAGARPDHRRLPPAHGLGPERREPRAGGLADLARAQGARPRARGADPRDVAALACGRAAPRQAADPLRSARLGLDRAGRRPRASSSIATSTTSARSPTSRASPRSSSRSTATGRPGTVKLSWLRRYAKFADLAAA